MTTTTVPDAELMIATGCTHCPVVLAGLGELIKAGQIGRLDVINIAQHPKLAEELRRRFPIVLTAEAMQPSCGRW